MILLQLVAVIAVLASIGLGSARDRRLAADATEKPHVPSRPTRRGLLTFASWATAAAGVWGLWYAAGPLWAVLAAVARLVGGHGAYRHWYRRAYAASRWECLLMLQDAAAAKGPVPPAGYTAETWDAHCQAEADRLALDRLRRSPRAVA